MKERMTSYNGPMGLAIWENRKRQTRRPVKFPFIHPDFGCEIAGSELNGEIELLAGRNMPFGRVGDIMLVREPAKVVDIIGSGVRLEYTGGMISGWIPVPERLKWQPIMDHKVPNGCWEGSERSKRLIKRVWVELVQDISNNDAWCEGVSDSPEYDCRAYYRDVWQSIYGTWDENSLVWCCEFEVMSNEGQ